MRFGCFRRCGIFSRIYERRRAGGGKGLRMAGEGQRATIKYLQDYIRAKDYHPEQVKEYFLKLTGEIGELADAIRKDLRPACAEQIKGTIEEEVWDAMYYLIAIANCYGMDLDDVIRKKEKINNEKYATGKTYAPEG